MKKGLCVYPGSFDPVTIGHLDLIERGADIFPDVVVELVQEALEDQALVPISAVDSRDRVWFVEDGIATPVEIDLTLRNDAYVAVPQEWAGKRVVLLPETASLYPGCAVKEARAR